MSWGGRRGFTLVEVLIAFVIVAVAVGASLEAISGGLSGVRAASAATARALLARSMMEAVGVESPLEAGVREGTFAGGERWRVTIAPAGGAAAEARGNGPADGLRLWRIDLVFLAGERETLAVAALKVGL